VGRTLSVTWSATSGASGYVIEAGSSSGASDLATFTADASATAVWRDVEPRRDIYIRVKAQSAAGVGPASSELRLEMPDFRDVIEALFLSNGPYAIPAGPRNPSSRMVGWAPGSTVVVRVPHDVTGAQFDAVDRTVAELNSAIGDINLVIVREALTRAEYDQRLPSGVTILVNQGQCLQPDGLSAACASSSPLPAYQTSRILMPTGSEAPRTWAHELGHTVGLRHVAPIFQIPNVQSLTLYGRYLPVMGTLALDTGTALVAPVSVPNLLFTDYELEAIRRVYPAGLRPGHTAADFAARGLIKP
jgi:hypothetical protein